MSTEPNHPGGQHNPYPGTGGFPTQPGAPTPPPTSGPWPPGPPPSGSSQNAPGRPPMWPPAPGPSGPSAGRTTAFDLPQVLIVMSSVAGLITYFMGFVNWVTISGDAEDEADRWSRQLDAGGGLPGFFSYEIVLNPGKFLIALGAIAIAGLLVLVPRYRRALPFLAIGAVAAWLALLAAALAVPPFLALGAGAIIALILGFLQAVLLFAASVIDGRRRI